MPRLVTGEGRLRSARNLSRCHLAGSEMALQLLAIAQEVCPSIQCSSQIAFISAALPFVICMHYWHLYLNPHRNITRKCSHSLALGPAGRERPGAVPLSSASPRPGWSHAAPHQDCAHTRSTFLTLRFATKTTTRDSPFYSSHVCHSERIALSGNLPLLWNVLRNAGVNGTFAPMPDIGCCLRNSYG